MPPGSDAAEWSGRAFAAKLTHKELLDYVCGEEPSRITLSGVIERRLAFDAARVSLKRLHDREVRRFLADQQSAPG
jgi:hypothetical protein